MPERMTINYEKKPCYDIVFSESFEHLKEELDKLNIAGRKVCIITDSHVKALYGDEVMEILNGHCVKMYFTVFRRGKKIRR